MTTTGVVSEPQELRNTFRYEENNKINAGFLFRRIDLVRFLPPLPSFRRKLTLRVSAPKVILGIG